MNIEQPDPINPVLLQAHLDNYECLCPIHHYTTIDSTNAEAERRIAQGTDTPCVVMANQQTAGRGRLGRTWYSNDLGNLYLSFVFAPNLPPSYMEKFTLWQGMAICATLQVDFDLPVKVKWPNDIIYQGKKIAGMLTQARIENGCTRTVIFGLGLNVNSHIDTWPATLQHTASSLARIAQHPLDIHAVAAAVIQAGVRAYDTFIAGEFEHDFNSRWQSYDGLKGQVVTISAPDGNHTGRALGIAPDGALLIELPNGNQRHFKAGDVTLHKTYSEGY